MSAEIHRDEAAAWRVRLTEPTATAADWATFTDWLEADPANWEAYDAISLADADLADSIETMKSDPAAPFNDNQTGPVRWYRKRGFLAVAAGIVLAVAVSPALIPDQLTAYETRPGEQREIALADGSHITMNGGTRLALDTKTARFAKLEQGEAAFTIKHDAARPFMVEAGDATLKDVGTVFNVRRDDDDLELSVAQGVVQYNPRAEAVTVAAGNQLRVTKAHPAPVVSKTDAAMVASWRGGRLSYRDAPLSAIAVDLTRAIGAEVTVSPEVANRRFSGIIMIDKDRDRLFRRLEALFGVRARHSGSGWQLTS